MAFLSPPYIIVSMLIGPPPLEKSYVGNKQELFSFIGGNKSVAHQVSSTRIRLVTIYYNTNYLEIALGLEHSE